MPSTSTFKVDAAACSVKLGGGVTVSVSAAVRVTPAPLAVMVNGYTPGVEVPSGANDRILDPEPGAEIAAGVKLEFRPVGRLPPPGGAKGSAAAHGLERESVSARRCGRTHLDGQRAGAVARRGQRGR